MTPDDIPQYLGIPYEVLGRKRERLDCWGLIYHVYKEQLGITLPLYDEDTAVKLARIVKDGAGDFGWERIAKPQHLCVVAMSQRGAALHHVGIFLEIDGGTVLHSRPPASSVQRLATIRAHGFHSFAYFRHHSQA